jgi:hypothetical protein
MSIRTESAGTLGTMAAFPIGEKRSSDNAELEKILGNEVYGKKGRKFRLVKYIGATALAGASAAGANVAGARLFAVAAGNVDDPTTLFHVQQAVLGGTAPLNRPIGVALKDQDDLVQNDYFWLQFDGDYMDLFMGDDGTNAAPGDYLGLDNDADLGTVKAIAASAFDSGGALVQEESLFVCMSTETGTDALVKGRPIHPLNG